MSKNDYRGVMIDKIFVYNTLISTIAILFAMESLFSQSVIKVEEFKNALFLFDAESENYEYIGLNPGKITTYRGDTIIDNSVYSQVDFSHVDLNIIKLNKSGDYINQLRLTPRSKRDSINNYNIAGFTSQGIYVKDEKLYVYGSVVLTDTMYLNDHFLKLVNKNEAFVLVFNEDLELIDEFYFGNTGKNILYLKGVVVEGNELKLCGKYGPTKLIYNDSLEKFDPFYLYIAEDSIKSVDQGIIIESIYYAVIDKDTKRMIRGQSFGGINNEVYEVKEDDEGNVYIACDGTGLFRIQGLDLDPEYRGYGYDFWIFKLDKEDKLIYKVLCQGRGNQSFSNMENENMHNYETFLSVSDASEIYMNKDTLIQYNELDRFLTKRDKNGKVEWASQFSNDANIYDIETAHDKWLIVAGTMFSPGCTYNMNTEIVDINNKEFLDQGFISLIDKESGKVNKIFIIGHSHSFAYSKLKRIKLLRSSELRIFIELGIFEHEDEFVFDIFGEKLHTYKSSTLSVDIDLSTVGVVEEGGEKLYVYPNPIVRGEALNIKDWKNEGKVFLHNINGQLIENLTDHDYIIPIDLNQGIYYISIHSNDQTLIEKIIIH